MTHLAWLAFAAIFFSAGFMVGVDAASAPVTRYTFTYGPVPSTADLLGGR